ncbi:hypothetical protein J6590_046718 [Homalodisca vitripennis]|nr:hypothetical protein J6590_046718 [Homalodisca vitripennis]
MDVLSLPLLPTAAADSQLSAQGQDIDGDDDWSRFQYAESVFVMRVCNGGYPAPPRPTEVPGPLFLGPNTCSLVSPDPPNYFAAG